MKTSQAGIDLIKKWEGCKLIAYRCSAGVLTIGFGRTKNVTEDQHITSDEAEALLKEDLAAVEKVISEKFPKLTQPMFDAIVSFSFNLGTAWTKGSGLAEALKAEDYSLASAQFLRWVYAGGKIQKGLINRRSAERDLFIQGYTRKVEL